MIAAVWLVWGGKTWVNQSDWEKGCYTGNKQFNGQTYWPLTSIPINYPSRFWKNTQSIVSTESARNRLALLVLALSNTSTPSAGSPWMTWKSSRDSKWRRTCAKPARSWRARWRTRSTSTRPTYSDKASLVVLLLYLQKSITFFVIYVPHRPTIKCIGGFSDLLRRQEELRRMEEVHSQEMQKRKEMQIRYLWSAEFFLVVNQRECW